MLVSNYEMVVAQETFPRLEVCQHPFMRKGDDAPATVLIGVRLPKSLEKSPALRAWPRSFVKVELFRQNQDQDINIITDTCRAIIISPNSHNPRNFSYFGFEFKVGHKYDIRLEFSLITPAASHALHATPDIQPLPSVGFLETSLDKILAAEDERVDALMQPGPYPRIASSPNSELKLTHSAEVGVKWCRSMDEKFGLEIRANIQMSGGWPYSARRPFFVLYRWESSIPIWTPVYRSEVLTAPKHGADDNMIFTPLIVPVSDLIGNEDDRQLRLELFHYKDQGESRLLAYVSTSLVKLRQLKAGSPLNLITNIVSKGDFVGEMTAHAPIITATKNFFTLQANFGVPIVGNFVFFSVSLTEPSLSRPPIFSRRNRQLPLYTISRFNDKCFWEEVLRSEIAPHLTIDKVHTFRLAKITEMKLNACYSHRRLAIRIHRKERSKSSAPIAYVITSTATLLESPVGTTFPVTALPDCLHHEDVAIIGDNYECGYIRLNQSEKRDTRQYFSISCVLGRKAPSPNVDARGADAHAGNTVQATSQNEQKE